MDNYLSDLFSRIDTGSYIIMWFVAMIVFIVIEVATYNLTTVWFACGSLSAAISAAFGCSCLVQAAVFAVSSLLLLIFTKPLVKKLRQKSSATNKDTLIGKESVVTEKIDNIAQSGYVKIGDVFWSARSKDSKCIEVGSIVTVNEINGNKLIVSKKD